MIDRFEGSERYLSNFHNSVVMYKGHLFLNAEAAFQGAKDESRLIEFTDKPPNIAKRMGRQAHLREDWEEVKDEIMYTIVKDKFERNEELKEKLLQTGCKKLVEGNTWGDTYWGICNGEGSNKLGEILMRIREELTLDLMVEQNKKTNSWGL